MRGESPRDPVARFRDEAWTAGVIGLGYVGLPLAVAASEAGLDVIGFDISEDLVDTLSAGTSHVGDVSGAELQAALGRGATFTADASQLAKADAIFIAVPSPLGRNRQPDTSFITSAAEIIAAVARPGQLVSLESTTYPGTTDEIIVPALETAGLTLDHDVFACFSPERVDPGNKLSTADIPKVVGGVTSLSGGGEWARSWAYGNAHLGGIYNPANHKVAIGNPRAGGGEHGSFPGMRIRNVRIGHR